MAVSNFSVGEIEKQIGDLSDQIANKMNSPVEVTSPSINNNSTGTANYPTGYSKSNCYVLGFCFESNNRVYWNTDGRVVLFNDYVEFTNNTGTTMTFKAYLMLKG